MRNAIRTTGFFFQCGAAERTEINGGHFGQKCKIETNLVEIARISAVSLPSTPTTLLGPEEIGLFETRR